MPDTSASSGPERPIVESGIPFMRFDSRGSRRLRLKRAANGMTGFGPVNIIDLGPNGLGIGHDCPLQRGATTWIEFYWGETMIRLNCEVRTTRASVGEMKFASGLLILGGLSADDYRRRVEAEIETMKAAESKLPPLI